MADPNEFPIARSDSTMVIRDGELVIWGGYTQTIYGEGSESFIVPINLPDPDSSLAEAEVCDLDSMEWRRISTRGQIPILGKGTVCGMYGCHVFVFSGLDDEDYRNDLYRLDLERLVWRKMPVHGVPPCPRSYGGMVVHGDCLIVFGGIGKPLKASGLPSSDLGGEVIKDTKFGGEFESEWNNYIHEYSTISGKWRELGCTGVRPPPLERFSFDKIDSNRALLFGGKRGLFTAGYHDIYILDLDTMHWTGPIEPSEGQLWPDARGVHATACVVDPKSEAAINHQKIIVFWGEGLDAIHTDDIWLLHVATMSWEKLGFSGLIPRKYHMCCSYFRQERMTDVIVYGGNKRRKSKLERNVMTDMLILRFGAVRRLKELCMRFVRSYSNVYNINLIPPGLRNELIEEDTLFPMLFYYHELPKQSVLKL